MSIEISHLTHLYNEGTAMERKALDDVNLTINDGEFVAIIGHTGSGKSTLIQHLNALMKPTGGKILLDGEDINKDKTKLKSIRQKIGLVFQYPEHQLFEMTIFKDVCYGPKNMGLNDADVEKAAKEALDLVGLDESFYDKSPFELSGGQKRRAAIAGILAMKPRVLVLDEPTAGVDPRGRNEIFDAINHMHHETGITVILVSHSMEDVAKYADRIIVMNQGRVALTGTPREVFSRVSLLEEIGLAAPQTSYVMKGLSDKGYSVAQDIYTVDEATEVLYDLLKQVKK
ncbi:energy-coupling factor transporter ATPase [Lachnospiraceae bacterium NSJ-143]|nr:energy-coupling factor transporter ATPase [Lachnospiraceae bacterium NSJ-143]